MSLMDTMDAYHSPSDEEPMDVTESYSTSPGSSVGDVTMAGSYQSDPYTGSTQGIAAMVPEAASNQDRHADDWELEALVYEYDYLQLQFVSSVSRMHMINGELLYKCAGCLRCHHSLCALQRHIALGRQEGFSCHVFYRATWKIHMRDGERLQQSAAPMHCRKRKRSADSSTSTSSPMAKRRRLDGPV